MKIVFAQAAVGCLILTSAIHPPAAAADGNRRQLDAHEHGVTRLNIAVDGGDLTAELEGPGMNFVGFEHPPRTAGQKQAVNGALALLRDKEPLFRMNSGAECTLVSADAQHVTDAADHDDHTEEHGEEQGEEAEESRHSEFTARFGYLCNDPDELTAISVGLFERFPLTTKIEVSFIGPDVQTFKELTPDDPTLELRR